VTALYAAWLGVVQGLTEFLPVSSSAHLILARAFFGWEAEVFGIPFDVACHVGTLLAVLVYFRREVVEMLVAAPAAVMGSADGPARLVHLLGVGTIPVVIVGLTLADLIERALRTPGVTAVTLSLGAVLLLAGERLGSRSRAMETITLREALVLGVAQAAALVPGVSRSGATIVGGMLMRLDRPAAAEFSFFLAMPVMTAAFVYQFVDVRATLAADRGAEIAVGFVAAFFSAAVIVRPFLAFVRRSGFAPFAWYRIVAGAAILALLPTE